MCCPSLGIGAASEGKTTRPHQRGRPQGRIRGGDHKAATGTFKTGDMERWNGTSRWHGQSPGKCRAPTRGWCARITEGGTENDLSAARSISLVGVAEGRLMLSGRGPRRESGMTVGGIRAKERISISRSTLGTVHMAKSSAVRRRAGWGRARPGSQWPRCRCTQAQMHSFRHFHGGGKAAEPRVLAAAWHQISDAQASRKCQSTECETMI